MADIDLGEVAEGEIAKRDRKIKRLEAIVDAKTKELDELKDTMSAMAEAKQALLKAADHLDPYRYDDD